jgi:hypothetical protein
MPALRNMQEMKPWLQPDDNAPHGQDGGMGDIASLLGGGSQQAQQPVGPSGVNLNEAGRSSQGPRENFAPQLRSPASGGMNAQAAPQRPEEPTPMAGSTQMGSSEGVLPFQPMGGPSPSTLAKPQSSLFGSMGGLQGGGLGVPLDPTPNAASDPITNLIQMLLGRA